MRVVENEEFYDPRDALSHEWQQFFQNILPEIVPIPLLNDPRRVVTWVDELDLIGVILSNGNDMNSSPSRDNAEKLLFDHCFNHDIPLLGVCRGLHAINYFMGGKIESSLSHKKYKPHVRVNHEIDIIDPSFTFLDSKDLLVNSYHNQGVLINGLSRDLKVFAKSKDGIIEGLFHQSKPILAIQWHPERSNPSSHYDKRLINTFFKNGIFW